MRQRILEAALPLLTRGGREALSTRAVTTAAGIQAPTLYRIFGDKQGLLDALALHGFQTHLATWDGWQPGDDPVAVLRRGWDAHIAWGVQNPYLYSIAYGDARPGTTTAASDAIDAILRTLVEQAAAAGLVTVPVERAVSMLRAVGTGVVFTLISMPEDARDTTLVERGREAALASFLVPAAAQGSRTGPAAAVHLKAQLPRSSALSANEKALLGDWLDRLAEG